jgi:hypothetical protein
MKVTALSRLLAAARATRQSMSGEPGYHGPASDYFTAIDFSIGRAHQRSDHSPTYQRPAAHCQLPIRMKGAQ